MSVSVKIRQLAAVLSVAMLLGCGVTATVKMAFGEEDGNESTRIGTSNCVIGSSTYEECFPDHRMAVQVAEAVPRKGVKPTDIMIQADVDQITKLSLDQISSLEGIQSLTSLIELSIDTGGVSDLSPLDDPVLSRNIKRLYIEECEITDVSPLRNYTNADIIDLMFNRISDISPLKDLHPKELTVLEQTVYLDRKDIRDNPNQAISIPLPLGKSGEPVAVSEINPTEGMTQTNTDLVWSAPAAGGTRSFSFSEATDDKSYEFQGTVEMEVVTAEPRLVTFTPSQPVNPQPTTGRQIGLGLPVPKPADPVCPGYRFVGWYTSARGMGGVRFNFEKPILENTALYGRWVSDTPNNDNDDEPDIPGPGTPDSDDDQTPLPELEKIVCEPGVSTYSQCFPDPDLAKQLASSIEKEPDAVLTVEDVDTQFRDISLTDVWDLNGIQILKKATYINLDYSYPDQKSPRSDQVAVDLRPVAELPEIWSFWLSGSGDAETEMDPLITDFTPLSKLKKLNELYIDEAGVKDLKGFESFTDMPRLTEVELEGNQISNVKPLAVLKDLPRMELLSLESNRIFDMSPLKDLSKSPIELSAINQTAVVPRHELPGEAMAISLPIRPDGKYAETDIDSISGNGYHKRSDYAVVWDAPVVDSVHSYDFMEGGSRLDSWEFDGTVTDRPLDDKSSARDIYKIEFDLGTGSTSPAQIPDQLVYAGNLANRVPDPVRFKHAFDGWYLNGEPLTPSRSSSGNKSDSPGNSSGTLIDSGNALARNLAEPGDILTRNLLVSGGSDDKSPTDSDTTTGEGPSDSDSTAEEDPFDFDNTRINRDIVLTARWTPLYTMTFDSQGGSAVPSQTVRDGETVDEPTDPTWAGHTFLGWFTEAQDGESADFSQPLRQDTTVYAHWRLDPTPANLITPGNPGDYNPGTAAPGSLSGILASTGSDFLGLVFAALIVALCGLVCQAHLRSRRSSMPR